MDASKPQAAATCMASPALEPTFHTRRPPRHQYPGTGTGPRTPKCPKKIWGCGGLSQLRGFSNNLQLLCKRHFRPSKRLAPQSAI
eukprot:5812638-Amphidinium_carterae.1